MIHPILLFSAAAIPAEPLNSFSGTNIHTHIGIRDGVGFDFCYLSALTGHSFLKRSRFFFPPSSVIVFAFFPSFFFVAGHISSLKRRPFFSLILPIRLLGLKFLAQQVYTVEEVSQRNHFPFFFYSFTSFSFQFVIFFDSLQLLEGDSGQEIKFLFIEPPFEKFSFPFFSIGRSYFPR